MAEDDTNVLSEEEIAKIKDAFDIVDSRGRGKFDPRDFKSSMESSGLHEKEPLIYSIICELDTEEAENNGVTFDELIKAINDKIGNKNSREGVRKIFDLFVNEFGEKLTNEQLKELLEKASRNGNELTFDEFYNVLIQN